MIVNVYTIRDIKLGAYNQPFYSQTHGSAIRAFADHVKDPNSMAHKHPEDFTLLHVGTFDDQTAELAGVAHLTELAQAIDYVNA